MASPRAAETDEGVKRERERKRVRYTDEEHQLILDTHETNQGKTWTRQAELYNEAAAKRGLPAGMTTSLFLSRCKRLLAEQEFAADRGAAYGPASRRRWVPVEDQALQEWNHKNKAHAEYEVYIKRMRESVDPSYFRSFTSVMGRIRSLGGCKVDGGDTTDAGVGDESGSVSGNKKRQRAERCDSATETDPVIDSGDHRVAESNVPLDIEPSNVSAGVQKVVKDKLRCMEKVSRMSAVVQLSEGRTE
jgi:hypothetical protein